MSNPMVNHRKNSPQPVLYHPDQKRGLLQALPVPDPSTFIPVQVPPNLSLPGPTEQELESRRITAISQGVRQIESAWPEGATRTTPRSTVANRGFNTRTRGGLFRRSNKGPFDRQKHGPSRGHPNSAPWTRQGSREQERHGLARRSYTDRALPLLMTLPAHGERGRTAGLGSDSRDRGQTGDNEHEIKAPVSSQDASQNNPDRSDIYNAYQTVEPAMANAGNGRGYESGRTRNLNGGRFRDQRALPFLMNNGWKDKDGISVRFSDAQMSFGIFEAYSVFKDYGEIETLDLYETKSGVLDGSGRVRFSGKVRTAFWQKIPFRYTDDWGKEGSLTLRLDEPRRRSGVPSPVDKGKVYPPKYVFKVKTLQFGLMYEQNAMMPMFTTADNDSVTLEVDLCHRALNVVFRIGLARNQSSPPMDPVTQGEETGSLSDTESVEKVEHYRFQIPFSHLGRLLEVNEPSSTTGRAFVIAAQSVPRFWRKFHDPLKTVVPGTKHWDIWSCWFRQTGISFENRTRASLPVSLKQTDQIINIGRWTTYRLEFDAEEAMTGSFNEMIAALKDFNINTDIVDGFGLLEEKIAPIWDYIDIKGTPDSNSFLHELHEASSPLLPYPVRYQLEVCMSQNCLSEYNITTQFIDRLASLPVSQAVSLLEYVAEKGVRIFQPMTVFDLRGIPKGTAGLKLPSHCQLVRKVNITPTTVYFATPSVEITNRVVRQYSEHLDRFLRVQFVDEKLQGRINSTDKKTLNEVFTRVKAALDNGITIGGRHFEFLAFGNSQIREHGAYFFSSTEHLSAADIRAWMGEFKSIRVVAKHAARLGQCFSTTRAISGVKVDVRTTEDITNEAGYTFSDGVGKISSFVAHLITTELDLKFPDNDAAPSCFQFRLGGCKGVLAVWPDARQREVFIRPSQRKFEATHNSLEVIRWSRFATAALNRQLITVLSSLGAPDRYFQEKLCLMLKRYEEAMLDPKAAINLLCKNVDFNESTLKIAAMVREGFMARQEPFVMSMLKLWRAWAIKYLKEKAKIMIDEGAFLLGIVDETGILDGYYSSKPDNIETSLPQIFVQVDDPENSGKFMIIEGPCIIARNPSLHPGDVRKVLAVNVPELHHLRNVVVFPQRGDRDLANMLSGGDLDGDDYIVIWDKVLTSSITNHPPMEYTPNDPYELNRDVEVNDITKFFVNYMRNDCLGTIANAHLAWSDKLDAGVMSEQCFRLASLHSDAVDYVKSGQRAEMPPELRVKKFPHFMEKEPDKTYQSEKILGFLYDAVSAIDFVPAFEHEFDDRILKAYNLDPSILNSAREIKVRYDSAMYRIMAQHDIRTEFEVISTFVMHHSSAVKDYKFHEEIGGICHSLKDTFRKTIYEVVGSKDAMMGPYVAAMYTVTQQEMANAKEIHLKRENKVATEREARENSGGGGGGGGTGYTEHAEFTIEEATKMPLISFPWLFAKILGRIANREYPYSNLNETPVGPFPKMELGLGRAPQVNGNGTERATWVSIPFPHAQAVPQTLLGKTE